MLICDGLQKSYGEPVLRGTSLRISGGEVVLLLGRNGAGKTTLFRCVSGLERHGGWVTVDGRAPGDECPDLLTMYDDCPLDPDLTVRMNLELLLGLRWNRELGARVAPFVTATDLRRRVRGFSYGERKRLWLAVVALSTARYYLLDEPTNGLDIEGIEWFRDLLASKRETGAVLVTAHLPHAYDGMIDRLLVLRDGLIEEVPDDLWRGRPLAEAARGLAGS